MAHYTPLNAAYIQQHLIRYWPITTTQKGPKKKRSCCIILIYPGHVSFFHGLDNSKRNKLFSSYFPTLLLNYNQMHPVDSLIRLFRDLAVYLARRGLAYSKTWIEFSFPFYFHFQWRVSVGSSLRPTTLISNVFAKQRGGKKSGKLCTHTQTENKNKRRVSNVVPSLI